MVREFAGGVAWVGACEAEVGTDDGKIEGCVVDL